MCERGCDVAAAGPRGTWARGTAAATGLATVAAALMAAFARVAAPPPPPPLWEVAPLRAALSAGQGTLDGHELRVRGTALRCVGDQGPCEGAGGAWLAGPHRRPLIALMPPPAPTPGTLGRLLAVAGMAPPGLRWGRPAVYRVRVWHPICPAGPLCAHRVVGVALVPLGPPE